MFGLILRKCYCTADGFAIAWSNKGKTRKALKQSSVSEFVLPVQVHFKV